MNLENVHVEVKSLSSDSYARVTKVEVELTRQIEVDVIQSVGTFKLQISRSFNNVTDPQLLMMIRDRLAEIEV